MKRRLAPQKALAEAAQKLSQNQSQKELFKATKQEKIEAISSEKINLVASSSQIAAFSNWSAKESDYNDLVEEILRAHLVLPEKGTVKLNLKIKESGQIVSYSIKSSSSDKNSQYIDENLARINFPTFDKTKTKRSVLELNINLSGKT